MSTKLLWERIVAAPDTDDEAYLVFADAIGGDVGERIVVMHQLHAAKTDAERAAAGAVRAAYLEAHRVALFGSRLGSHRGIAWDWHLGFLRTVSYVPDYEDDVEELVDEIFALPCAALLRKLVVFESVPALSARPRVELVRRADGLDEARAGTRWLRLACDERIPDAVFALRELEWLELSGGVLAIPDAIGALAKLRRLDVDNCGALAELSDELFGIEALATVSMANCTALRERYRTARLDALLAGFARAATPKRRRIVEAKLLLRPTDRTRASRDDLLAALDCNVADVRATALAQLAHVLPDPFAGTPLPAGARFAIAGKLNQDKKRIAAKLAEHGAKVTPKPELATHLIIGDAPGGKQLDHGDRILVLEPHLQTLFGAAGAPAIDLAAIRTRLRSRDEWATTIALEALDDRVDPSLLGDLVIVAQDPELKKARTMAKKLLAAHAPIALSEAIRTHLGTSLFADAIGEIARRDRLTAVFRDAGTLIDPIDFALALVERARIGMAYVFAHGTSADIARALAAVVARTAGGTTLALQTCELSALPDEVGALDRVDTVYLYGNRLTEVPPQLLALPLATLDLARNQIATVPAELARLPLVKLSLAGNRLVEFPAAVLGCTALRDLDLSSAQTYTGDEPRIVGLPDGIGALAQLRRLGYRFQIVPELPDGLFELAELEELDLSQCDLPAKIPDELAQLTKLRRLRVWGSTWEGQFAQLARMVPRADLT